MIQATLHRRPMVTLVGPPDTVIPKPPALSLTHDLLRVLSLDTWWNFGHE